MSDRIRLDAYLPVQVDGHPGYVQELSLAELAVDVSCSVGLPRGEQAAVLLRLTDRLVVHAHTTVAGLEDGAPAGMRRHTLRVESWEGDGEQQLVGHISSLRKSAHLNIVANEDVEAAVTRAGWDSVRLPHDPMPDRHPDELDLNTELFGRALKAPIVISGMTGGSERAGEINRRLALAAQELGLAMGLGSQRAMLEQPGLAASFQVRDVAPDILLLGNIGAVQLNYGVTADDCKRLVDAVQADALCVHLNPLQEMVQPEGDRDWRGLRAKVAALIDAMHVPVVLKETGCGMTAGFARAAVELGAAGLDVGGTGGTSWGWIEGFRAADPQRQAIGATFREWGVPTADALAQCRGAVGHELAIIATGGVRTGLDVAAALALGADAAGMALPFFKAADQGVDEAVAFGARIIEELRIATFCSGAASARGLSELSLERT